MICPFAQNKNGPPETQLTICCKARRARTSLPWSHERVMVFVLSDQHSNMPLVFLSKKQILPVLTKKNRCILQMAQKTLATRLTVMQSPTWFGTTSCWLCISTCLAWKVQVPVFFTVEKLLPVWHWNSLLSFSPWPKDDPLYCLPGVSKPNSSGSGSSDSHALIMLCNLFIISNLDIKHNSQFHNTYQAPLAV